MGLAVIWISDYIMGTPYPPYPTGWMVALVEWGLYVVKALLCPLSLLLGPPGGGSTQWAVYMVYGCPPPVLNYPRAFYFCPHMPPSRYGLKLWFGSNLLP